MKVSIVGCVGVPANYGGFETLVENMLLFKNSNDIDYTVYCSAKEYELRLASYNGAKLKYLPFRANGAQALLYDTLSIFDSALSCDVILSLGCSGAFILPFVKLFTKKRVILNIDGLDNKRKKFNYLKRLMITLSRRIAANQADVIIADNRGIVEDVESIYKRESALIEYGGDEAYKVNDDSKLYQKYGLEPQRYFFKVARIEPENNIEIILDTFSNIPDKKLVIVGNWNKSIFGISLRDKYSAFKNIMMLNPIYNQNELNLLRSNCVCYIHGHSVGGTNPSLVEAMSLGLPIISFDVKYNRYTTENKAIYFSTKGQLNDAVNHTTPQRLSEIGAEMGAIAKNRYSWSRIVEKYECLLKGV